jgi:hypothetical protein
MDRFKVVVRVEGVKESRDRMLLGADRLGCTGTKHSAPRARSNSRSDRVERPLMVNVVDMTFKLASRKFCADLIREFE